MHQGSWGTKFQKSYFRTKITQMAENGLLAPKLDPGAPPISMLKSGMTIMVFYALECTKDHGAPKPKSLIFARKLHKRPKMHPRTKIGPRGTSDLKTEKCY